jgi:transposase-like protein
MVATRPTAKPSRVHQKHSIEFKISAARQVIETGKSQPEVSRETNVTMSNIHKWIALARAGRLGSYKVPAFGERTGDLASEVRRFERELEQVRQERDFFLKNPGASSDLLDQKLRQHYTRVGSEGAADYFLETDARSRLRCTAASLVAYVAPVRGTGPPGILAALYLRY